MSDTSRRSILTGTAAALAGGAALGAAALIAAKAENGSVHTAPIQPDPIFTLIERHREAELRKLAAGAAYAVVAPSDPNHAAAVAADNAARDAQEDAGAALLETKPTTRAGIFALVDYVLSFNEGGVALPDKPRWCSSACDWPEMTDDDGIDVTGFAFLKHIIDALKTIERKAVAS
jgi:hypothetical protein